MKHSLVFLVGCMAVNSLVAQTDKTQFPDPEFNNEVYLYRKDDPEKLMRLEKDNSKMQTKMKMMGMGGAENAYTLEGEQSKVRLQSGDKLVFIYSTETSSVPSSPQNDSMMRANNMDPSMMQGYSMMDPANMITLYKAESVKGNRKIYMMKTGGAFSMGKNKSSDKYTFSIKKIRPGYWQLFIDKNLPKGEYAFSVMGMGMGNMDGSATIFAFGID